MGVHVSPSLELPTGLNWNIIAKRCQEAGFQFAKIDAIAQEDENLSQCEQSTIVEQGTNSGRQLRKRSGASVTPVLPQPKKQAVVKSLKAPTAEQAARTKQDVVSKPSVRLPKGVSAKVYEQLQQWVIGNVESPVAENELLQELARFNSLSVKQTEIVLHEIRKTLLQTPELLHKQVTHFSQEKISQLVKKWPEYCMISDDGMWPQFEPGISTYAQLQLRQWVVDNYQQPFTIGVLADALGRHTLCSEATVEGVLRKWRLFFEHHPEILQKQLAMNGVNATVPYIVSVIGNWQQPITEGSRQRLHSPPLESDQQQTVMTADGACVYDAVSGDYVILPLNDDNDDETQMKSKKSPQRSHSSPATTHAPTISPKPAVRKKERKSANQTSNPSTPRKETAVRKQPYHSVDQSSPVVKSSAIKNPVTAEQANRRVTAFQSWILQNYRCAVPSEEQKQTLALEAGVALKDVDVHLRIWREGFTQYPSVFLAYLQQAHPSMTFDIRTVQNTVSSWPACKIYTKQHIEICKQWILSHIQWPDSADEQLIQNQPLTYIKQLMSQQRMIYRLLPDALLQDLQKQQPTKQWSLQQVRNITTKWPPARLLVQ